LETGAGDGLRVQNLLRNSEVLLHEQRLHDITRISLQGSEIAERLANAHRNRPCFKKIDTLCARLKQDLLRPDGVLPNINSQGIAWAVIPAVENSNSKTKFTVEFMLFSRFLSNEENFFCFQ